MGRIDGRTAIVTGAGDGIGRGIARRFAREGAKVLVADIDGESGERVAAEITGELGGDALAVRTDVSRKAEVQAMVEAAAAAWGSVDILVNNAWGGATLCRFEDKTDEQMAHGLSLALYGPFWAMQAAVPHMLEGQWGRVVNICSLAGTNAFAGTLEYNAAKEALRAMTRTAAREWAPDGIVVNAICPGAKGSTMRYREEQDPDGFRKMEQDTPMHRIGDPEEDVAPVALFLASEDARYVTGNTVFADGGGHINGMSWDPNFPPR
jgi:NAD(P)-dependent dehydrogenase (short-subunit alcohol dehydrogenase family)